MRAIGLENAAKNTAFYFNFFLCVICIKDMETQPGSSPEAGSSSLTVSYNVEEAEEDDDFKSTQESKDEQDDLPPSYDDIIHNRTSGVEVGHMLCI